MYIPAQYKNEKTGEVLDFIRQNSFGILVTQLDGKPWATHLPLELEEEGENRHALLGHISKANAQVRALEGKPRVLCIFNGPHAYVSSSWYREEEVPTWDYIAVHVYGILHVLNQEELYDSLDRMVKRYEANSREPVDLQHLSPKTMRQIRGIVGFRIEVEDIHAAYKLSQGRPEDHPRILEELEAREDQGSRAIADAIRKQQDPLR